MECKGLGHLMETVARVCFFCVFFVIGEGEGDQMLYFSGSHCQGELHTLFLLTLLVNSLIMMKFLERRE